MTDLQHLELQAEALFTHDARGRICFVNEPGGDRAPRFFFARSRRVNLWRCRDDLAEPIVQRLGQLVADEPVRDDLRAPPRNLGRFLAALSPSSISSGPAYRFPDELAPAAVTRLARSDLHLLHRPPWNLEETALDVEAREPFMAVIEHGVVVSLCHSSRLTDRAAEAGLETLASHRRRGHAVSVTAAWALAVRATGRVPLYSTSWDNLASQAVARRLGLILYGTNLSLP